MKQMSSIQKLREASMEELEATLQELLVNRFRYRVLKSTNQLAKPHLLKQVRRDIARVYTVLTERQSAQV